MFKWLVFLSALLICGGVWAQPINQYVGVGPYPFQALSSGGFGGYCQFTISGANAVNVSNGVCPGNIPVGADIALICVENGALRYRDDGGTPTGTNGMPISVGIVPNCFSYSVVSPGTTIFMGALRMISAGTTAATVNIEFYR